MAYHTKMFLRMCVPALAVLAGSMLLAFLASTLSTLPMVLGGGSLFPGLGDLIALGGLVVATVVYSLTLVRFRRWERGHGDCCFVCGCLVGTVRDGRFGPYRRCLGCGKNHAWR